jgi:hypothetical protein
MPTFQKLFSTYHEPIKTVAEHSVLPLHVAVAATHAYTLAALAAGVIALIYVASIWYQSHPQTVASHDE